MKFNMETFNKNNFFYRNRKEIDRISRTQNVDAGVATSIFAHDHKGEYTNAEINEWQKAMTYFQQGPRTLDQLFR